MIALVNDTFYSCFLFEGEKWILTDELPYDYVQGLTLKFFGVHYGQINLVPNTTIVIFRIM